MEIENDVMQQKIDDLEKTSVKQSLEIEQLKSSLSDCLARLASLESKTGKGKNDVPNSLKLSLTKGKDVQLRKSMVSPRTPVKSMRSSGTPTRRSANDLSKPGHIRKRPWKPPGGAAVIICPLIIKKLKSKKTESSELQKISIAIYKDFYVKNQKKHFSTPWRPAGISLLFCNLSSSQVHKHIRLAKSAQPMTRPMIDSNTCDLSSITKSGIVEGNHKDTTFLKGEGALKIFIRGRPINLYAPSTVAENFDMKAMLPEPDESLQMEWVYGYRGKDCRKNMYYLPTGDLVYFVAGIVVLHNVANHVQRHYTEHTDDVKCLTVHPDKVTFASGQVASHSKIEGKPHVRIWSSATLQTLHIIGLGFFERAVAVVAFSKSDGGNLLCTVDEANDHNVTLWNWAKKKSIATAKSSTEAVVEAEFHPKDSNMIVTCGKNHLAFWNVEKSGLVKKTAIYEKYEKPKFVTCVCFTDDGDLISGDSSGNIFIWNKDKRAIVAALNKAHNGPVFSLLITESKTLISGGGKDNAIYEWDISTKEKSGRSFQLSEEYGSCRMVCEKAGELIVGTTLNCIVTLTENECEPILQGHFEELWSIYQHATNQTFVSGGYDKKIIVWDANSHKALSTKQLEKTIHSICLSPVSDLCVAGCSEGHWVVCDLSNGGDVHHGRDGVEAIQCCEFKPDGSHFALGSRDNHIYVYKLDSSNNEVTKVGTCTGHSSFITHLDWSSDGQYLRTNSGDYELLFWNATDCKQIKASSTLADVVWATCNCSLCFEVAGVWPDGSDGTDINAVAKAHNKPIMASADDFGKVNLFRFPASQPKAAHKIYGGHSSHVTGVTFLNGDARLASIGGQDTAIVQWRLV